MALKKKPITGMRDVMPGEMEIREYCTSVIQKTYASYGFQSIETPCVENIENLTSKSGGDNEKLIFKILKRGEKLRLDEAKSEADLVDGGLRYDLTVPLVRYYAAHENELPMPFKALQMGNVWRADRPQKGRYRQFMQCDIDIIGEPTYLAEIELILAASSALGQLGFKNYQIRINDRRILKAIARYSGFPDERFDEICIVLDKMDKIGLDGVEQELQDEGFAEDAVQKYVSLYQGLVEQTKEDHALSFLEEKLEGYIEKDILPNLREIIQTVETAKEAEFQMVFDPTIVRGMSYYTGTIFEIALPQLGISAGGGGRYDEMVGRFTGKNVPACGVSIGFERIILVLLQEGFTIPGKREKKAYLLDRNISSEDLKKAMKRAQKERAEGKDVLVVHMNRNRGFQKKQLSEQGYTSFEEIHHDEMKE